MGHNRVLVADRNPSFLDKTKEILAGIGVRMIPVSVGSRVLDLCTQEQPDGLLLHVDLPTLPGTEICHRIKTELDPTLPVVLMFPEETKRAAEIAEQCNADNYLIRPLKRTELLYCARELLLLRKLLCELPVTAQPGGAARRHTGMTSLEIFHAFLGLELRRVDRYGFPLSILDVGVDPLPEDAGAWSRALDDQLGPALAAAIRATLRDIDVCAMVTSRDLLVVMPHTDKEGALLVGKRICRTVGSQPYHFGRARIQPTVSVGLVCVHGERMTQEEALDRARRLRTRAADAGGNRVLAL